MRGHLWGNWGQRGHSAPSDEDGQCLWAGLLYQESCVGSFDRNEGKWRQWWSEIADVVQYSVMVWGQGKLVRGVAHCHLTTVGGTGQIRASHVIHFDE